MRKPKTRAVVTAMPEPVRTESRICFGIAWFATEAVAIAYGRHVRKRGDTYNGGYFDGMSCGRDSAWDYTTPEGQKLFAVTVQ